MCYVVAALKRLIYLAICCW